jgi:hypothetical protein
MWPVYALRKALDSLLAVYCYNELTAEQAEKLRQAIQAAQDLENELSECQKSVRTEKLYCAKRSKTV